MSSEKLKKLEERRSKIVAEIARVKAREGAAERKAATRKKIIAGGLILGMLAKREVVDKSAFFAALDKSLIRPQDRALFELPPLSPPPPAKE